MGNIFQGPSAAAEVAPETAEAAPVASHDPTTSSIVPDRPTSGKRKRSNSSDEEKSSPANADVAKEAPPLKKGTSAKLQLLSMAVTPTPPPKTKLSKHAQRLYKERASILKTLPDQFKAMSGTIGFCKFGKKQRVPALIVDVSEAPEGEIWDQWIKAYERRRKENKLHCLPYIVYYYCNDGNLCFGVVSLSAFTPYEEEVRKGDKGIATLPNRFQRKVARGDHLTFHDECMIEAYESMEEDLQKESWERKRWEL